MQTESYSVFDEDGISGDFFKKILPFMPTFIQVKIERHLILKITDKILSQLNLSSISSLRDRFEGVAYYDKTLKKVGGLYTIHKLLKTEKFEFDINKDCKEFIINDETFEILLFKFGQLPKLNVSNNQNRIVVMQKNDNCFYFCGVFEFNKIPKKLLKSVSFVLDDFNQLINPKDFLENVRHQ
jgi:hypothetical protein